MLIDNRTPIGDELRIEHPDCMLRITIHNKRDNTIDFHTVSDLIVVFSCNMFFDIFSNLLLTVIEVKG